MQESPGYASELASRGLVPFDELFFSENRLGVARAATHFAGFGPNGPAPAAPSSATPAPPETAITPVRVAPGSVRAQRRFGFLIGERSWRTNTALPASPRDVVRVIYR